MLRLNNIEVTYLNVVRVLHGISLEVPDSGIVALLGANGAGKTTTLKAISGLLRAGEGEVTGGTIEWDGERIDRKTVPEIARLGIIQVLEGRRVFGHLTIEENLLIGAHNRTDRAEVRRDLEMVYDYFPTLKNVRQNRGGDLYEGERQMLVTGRAMMATPRLLLLDEPMLGLAPTLVHELYEILNRFNSERKTAILLAEENARTALSLANYGHIIENGRMVLDGPTEKLKESQELKAFLALSP